MALLGVYVCARAQEYPTFCFPMDCSPPGSSVHGIFQARTQEWVAISSSRGSSPLAGSFFITSATWEAHSTWRFTYLKRNPSLCFLRKSQTIITSYKAGKKVFQTAFLPFFVPEKSVGISVHFIICSLSSIKA